MIPQSFIQDLLNRVDIVDVVERHVPLKKAGANYQACCPFHSEKSPSFTVSPAKQFYHCFGCGAHGSAIGFLMEYSGLPYPEAIEELARQAGMTVPREDFTPEMAQRRQQAASLTEVTARAANFYRQQLKKSPRAIDYLKGRGLSGEVAARFGIGYAPDGWQGLREAFDDYEAAALNECAELLSLITDFAVQDNQLNIVAVHLQTSTSSLREAIAKAKSQPKRAYAEKAAGEDGTAPPAEPTRLNRIVAFLCHLALSSGPAQRFLAEQFETLHEANRWLEGIPLLETILGAAPDPSSNAAVNTFMSGLSESDRLALAHETSSLEGVSLDGMQAAEQALALLSGTVLQRRDAAVKAELKQAGLSAGRMIELLHEAKEISGLLRGIGQRSEFDDELPASTFKEKLPPWKKRFDPAKKG